MATEKSNVIVSFDNVCFSFNDKKKIILECADFTVRENTKITIMGQNGAGKSTIFKLLMREEKPESGKVNIVAGNKIAIARQVIPRDQLNLSLEEYFATAFLEKEKLLDKKIDEAMDAVNLTVDRKKALKDLSGGQQARVLLAYALIQKPDILLLDEPTNNLDSEGIGHLLSFLLSYEKTVIVISHDADFLNVFTDGVLYLNVQKHQVEQYWGDYYTVMEDIKKQIEREQMQNARMEKEIQDKKDKINFFANKGGKMRKLASKMRDDVEEAEEQTVTVRKDDKTIQKFHIDYGNFIGPIITISKITLMNREHEIVSHDMELIITKGERYILTGPNGIGKTTLLKKLVNREDPYALITEGVNIGYYSQDFADLDMEQTVWESLQSVTDVITDQETFRVASQFLLTSDLLKNKVYSLSEGQKWLLCYARFMIQKPDLLILDEPTNHINFRHIPVIAESLNSYKGALIMVSHDEGFVQALQDVRAIDLKRLIQ